MEIVSSRNKDFVSLLKPLLAGKSFFKSPGVFSVFCNQILLAHLNNLDTNLDLDNIRMYRAFSRAIEIHFQSR